MNTYIQIIDIIDNFLFLNKDASNFTIINNLFALLKTNRLTKTLPDTGHLPPVYRSLVTNL